MGSNLRMTKSRQEKLGKGEQHRLERGQSRGHVGHENLSTERTTTSA
jgi:hypothetical protein